MYVQPLSYTVAVYNPLCVQSPLGIVPFIYSLFHIQSGIESERTVSDLLPKSPKMTLFKNSFSRSVGFSVSVPTKPPVQRKT